MKKSLLIAAVLLALAAPNAFAGGTDHTGHGMNYGNYTPGKATHQEVVDGVKATFTITPMQKAMAEMGMAMPQGAKETHHVSASFNDMKSGKPLTSGAVTVKIMAPDKYEQTLDLPAMHGHFGADFVLAKQGKYGVMCTFKLADGTVRSAKFWYEIR